MYCVRSKTFHRNVSTFHMPRLTLNLLGLLRITLDEKPVTALESVKVRALLIFLALKPDKPHARDELIGLLWAEHSQERARGNLRRALWNLQQTFKPPTLKPPTLKTPSVLNNDAHRVAPRGENTWGLSLLLTTRETIQFNPAYDAHVDVWEFEKLTTDSRQQTPQALSTVRHLSSAVALYRGEFLQNFFVPDAPAFEEWLLLQREHFQRRVVTALGQITAHYEQMGAAGYAGTERYARRHIELEAWSEEPYRALMRTYAAQNQTAQAIAAYHALASVLHHELGLEPSAETNALFKHLRNQSSGGSGQLAVVSNQYFGSMLPLPTTPLVGRETELAQLAEKITRADCRLLTLVGQGGIGKTRLALETARANRQAFPRGAYFVDLAAVVSLEMLPRAIAEAMHLQLRGKASTAEQLTAHLQDLAQPLLLILDNFEQLLTGSDKDARSVGELLKRAPQVTLLVTSRERLNLAGEWLFPVEGLRAPTTLPARIESEWAAAEAVQLLAQCAARQHIDTDAWSADEKRAGMRITQLVEGMPLAIELAAAWLRTLSPIEIADEIARSLDVLTSAQRDLPARHASIRAVFEHSWVLLTPTEQDAFARMSIFRGGLTREAAREIANASLQTVSALVEKSLVKRTAAGRYRLHELVRQFAAEKLALSKAEGLATRQAADAAEGLTETRAQHARYFLNLLVERGNSLNSERARDSLAELLRENENVRAAWQWACKQRDTASLERGLPALANFYVVAGLVQEGEPMLRETIGALNDGNSENNTALLSQIYAHLANFYLHIANYPQAIEAGRKAMALGRAADVIESQVMGEWLMGTALDKHAREASALGHIENALAAARAASLPILEAQILYALGDRAYFHYAYQTGQELLLSALALVETTTEQRLTSDILTLLAGTAYRQADSARSQELLQRALALKRMLGDPHGQVQIYVTLGNVAVSYAQLDRALQWYHQAATLALEIGDQTGLLRATVNHAGVMMLVGEFDAARAEYGELLPRAKQLGEKWIIYYALNWLTLLENSVGDAERALTYGREYAALAASTHDAHDLAYARDKMADAYLAQGDLAEAEQLYRQVLLVYQEKNDRDHILRCQAGFARIALARGDTAQARAWAIPLRDALLQKFPRVDVEPLRLFLTCYEILRACNDASAAEVLHQAHIHLQKNAAAIQDERLRASYVQNFRWHREIVRAWNETQSYTNQNE